MSRVEEVVLQVQRLRRTGPVLVGISGFRGAGKSTLTRELLAAIPGSTRVRGSDFVDPNTGLDRGRLSAQVLTPFRDERTDAVLLIDAADLFHPDLVDAFTLRIWVDTPLTVASARGRARDRERGRDTDTLWTEVWTPADFDFAARFAPRERADLHVITIAR